MGLIERRIGLLFAVFLFVMGVIALRAVQLGTLQGDRLAQAATRQHVQEVTVPASRGTITDRNGVELAVAEPASDVSATPYLVKDPARVAAKLAPLLEVEEGELIEKLTRRDTGFVYLKRKVPADRADRIAKLGIEGIDLTPSQRRTYPRDYMASQVLGMVGTDGDGLAGIEHAFDRFLRGQDGLRRIVRDGVGDDVVVRDVKPARPGARIELTLDATLQDKVEEVLKDIGSTYRPKGATAIVADPSNGEILALANWPRVNANAPAGAPEYPRQNRAVGFAYEPGSTFKAITMAGALEDGVVTPDTAFNLPPQIQVADRVIKNAEERGWVTLTTREILAHSDNVGTIVVGKDRLGAKRFDHWVRRFGFGKPTGTDLPGEERGIVLPLEKYSGSSMGNLPIGHGELVTPLQITQAYIAIANGGILRTPHIVRSIDGRPTRDRAGRRVISERTAAQLREMLEGVLKPGGTASEVEVPGYTLAGKTGTANKLDTNTGEYSQSKYIASFVGFAPARRPRVVISIVVDEPQGAIYGGQIAAPAFGKIAAFAMQYLEIPPR